MNGKDAIDRARSKTLGVMKTSDSGATVRPNGQQLQQAQTLQPSGPSSAYFTQENVNLDSTQKYIKILEEKIREYRSSLVEEQIQRESQTARAIEELNNCGHDLAKQEHTKKRLQREQGEFTVRTQNIQRNIQKLEYKLTELRAHGIPKQVVPDDYVRQLKKKDSSKKHRVGMGLLQMPNLNLLKGKTASSGDLLVGGATAGGGSGGGPSSVSGVAAAVGSPQKKSQSLEHGAVPLPPLTSHHQLQQQQQQQQQASVDSDRLTVSSSEPNTGGKLTSLSDEDGSRVRLPVTFGLGLGGGGPRSTASRSNRPKSRASSSVSSESARQHASAVAASSNEATAAAAPACDPTESLRTHFEHLLEEQRRALTADLDVVRNRLQDEAGDIHKLVGSEIHKLRYDQQELSASLDDNQKELEKMKVFLTNLSKEIGKLMLVDQQIDDINNKIAVLSRDLQGPGGACPHGRPDSAATTSTRLLNLLVALLSYGFVAASCLINLLLWLLGFMRSRPFIIVCLAAALLALLFHQWPALAPLLTPDGLGSALARGCPQAVRRFLAELALALNRTADEASAG